MLGGGNPVSSSNPVGTSSTLNYIGNHVYGYSGTFPATTSAQTMMEFDTFDNTYIVGEFVLCGSLQFATGSNGRISTFQLSINGEVVAVVKNDPQAGDYTGDTKLPILLEPGSKIKLEVISNDASADDVSTVLFTGRTYQ
tara:strand:- start:51 stop:470 length:420 start_codon:yes stop_codon:yes gene_type:complete